MENQLHKPQGRNKFSLTRSYYAMAIRKAHYQGPLMKFIHSAVGVAQHQLQLSLSNDDCINHVSKYDNES